MARTYRSNHSLWPQQARSRSNRASALAVGSFCIGLVAAFSAHNVLSDLFSPRDDITPSTVAAVPVYATAPQQLAIDMQAAAPKAAEPANAARSRLVVTKLPTVNPVPAATSDTDGRGAAAGARSGEASSEISAAATPPSAPPTRAAEIAKPAEEASAARAEPQQNAAASDRPKKQRSAHKRRDQSQHASRNRNNPFFPFFPFFGQRG